MLSAMEQVGKRVVGAAGARDLGTIRECVVDPEAMSVLGFVVEVRGWLAPPRVLLLEDTERLEGGVVVVKVASELIDPQDRMRVLQLLQRGVWLQRARAITESSRVVGVVVDVFFSSQDGAIRRIHASDGRGRDPRAFEEPALLRADGDALTLATKDQPANHHNE